MTQQNLPNRVAIDVSETTPVVCDNCGHQSFMQTYILRLVSAVYSPTGEESMLPIPVFECSSCGHINNRFLPDGIREPEVDDLETDDDDE
mgnify:CR=1 FL=1